MPCPHCKATAPAVPVGFYLPTFLLLGKLGVKLFHVARCPQCRKAYDAKNGTTLGGRLAAMYIIATIVLALVARYAIQH